MEDASPRLPVVLQPWLYALVSVSISEVLNEWHVVKIYYLNLLAASECLGC